MSPQLLHEIHDPPEAVPGINLVPYEPPRGAVAPRTCLSSPPPPALSTYLLSFSLSPSFLDVYSRKDDLVLRLPDVKLLRVGFRHLRERLLDYPAASKQAHTHTKHTPTEAPTHARAHKYKKQKNVTTTSTAQKKKRESKEDENLTKQRNTC